MQAALATCRGCKVPSAGQAGLQISHVPGLRAEGDGGHPSSGGWLCLGRCWLPQGEPQASLVLLQLQGLEEGQWIPKPPTNFNEYPHDRPSEVRGLPPMEFP